jgi:hypothetical protein
MWLTAHFLFWDYSETLPAERFSVDGVTRYLASKDLAIFNQIAVWGSVRFADFEKKCNANLQYVVLFCLKAVTASVVLLIPPVVLNTFNLVPAVPTAAGKKKKKVSKRFNDKSLNSPPCLIQCCAHLGIGISTARNRLTKWIDMSSWQC